jgi:hypothetical protein
MIFPPAIRLIAAMAAMTPTGPLLLLLAHIRADKVSPLLPVCRKTSQKRAPQNDNVQQPSVGANG